MKANTQIQIELVGRFNSIDFSQVTQEEAEIFMMNESFKLGLSLNEAEAVTSQISI